MIDKALLEKARQAARNADAANQNVGRDPELSGDWRDPIEASVTTYLAGMWRPIEEAPRDGTLQVVYVSPRDDLPGFKTACARHDEAGWCADELREVTHFIPLSALPVPEEKE